MDQYSSQMAVEAISFMADTIKNYWCQAASDATRPSVLLRPKLFIDGHQWCALYGENLQDGLAGFGDTPAGAMYDFDINWTKSIEVDKDGRHTCKHEEGDDENT